MSEKTAIVLIYLCYIVFTVAVAVWIMSMDK